MSISGPLFADFFVSYCDTVCLRHGYTPRHIERAMYLKPGFIRQVSERKVCPNFVHMTFLSLLDRFPQEIARYQKDKR